MSTSNNSGEFVNENALNDMREPLFIYRGNRVSKVDVELVKKYPGSYFYREYMRDNRTIEGDVFIDIDGKNDELIVKYMKNDESLIEDMKKMSIEERRKFLDDLNFLELPIKKEFVGDFGHNEEKEKTDAKQDRRVVMVNGRNAPMLNALLKQRHLFDHVFDSQPKEDIRYFEEANIYYINLKMKYYDLIECYLKDRKFSIVLIKKYKNDGNFDVDELIKEMKMLGIELNEKDEYTLYFDKEEPSFVYREDRVSKVDVELVKKYPGSYFYSDYMRDLRTTEGDVFIDMDGENDELIVKYMKEDESLIDDLKKMKMVAKEKFLDDLIFLRLPIKKAFMREIFCNRDHEITEESESRNELNDSTPSDCLNNMSMYFCSILVNQQYDSYLRKWLGDHKWKLIYRASEHGYTATSFHECCDNKGPKLIVIKSREGWIFGGYTTQSWTVVHPEEDGCIYYYKYNNNHS